MTAVLTITCDDTFDHGRQPCRGALPHPVHDIHSGIDQLTAKARAAGWLLTPDGDYCPAHARAKETHHAQH